MAKKKKRNLMYNHDADTWTDDGKDQTHLGMGSVEYEAYVEDLKVNAPSAPDDEMHADLEEYNAEIASDMARRMMEKDNLSVEKKKYILQQSKRSIAPKVHKEVLEKALRSDRTDDDRRAGKLGMSNPIILDDEINADEYAGEVEQFVLEKTF